MMTMALADRPFLSSVRTALTDRIRFCSRCGITREEREVGTKPVGLERVCSRCGMGVMLNCSRDALPTDGMSFLIVTEDLRISAVSEAAERVFGEETELLGTMLFATMTCPLGLEELALRIARAASGERNVILLPIDLVRGARRGFRPGFGRLEVRIAACGPPRGALVALEPLVLETD
jgi:ribosomal protein S27AE